MMGKTDSEKWRLILKRFAILFAISEAMRKAMRKE